VEFLDNHLTTLFSAFGKVLSVQIPQINGIISGRPKVLFHQFPPPLANVTKIILGSRVLHLSWPYQPTADTAVAMDLTSGFSPALIPTSHARSIVLTRQMGKELRKALPLPPVSHDPWHSASLLPDSKGQKKS